MEGERWLTVAQAAEQIQVHPETVREWLRTGRLPGQLISRRAGWRVRQSNVNRFLSGNLRHEPEGILSRPELVGPVVQSAPRGPDQDGTEHPPASRRSTLEDPVRSVADPGSVEHPELRELARSASWVAKLEAAVEYLEDLADLVDDEGDAGDGEAPPGAWDGDPLAVALEVVRQAHEEADQELEADLAGWLARDPEHWPIFRLAVLDAWTEAPGRLRHDAPGWVGSLTTNAALAHYQQDPYGRRRVFDPSLLGADPADGEEDGSKGSDGPGGGSAASC